MAHVPCDSPHQQDIGICCISTLSCPLQEKGGKKKEWYFRRLNRLNVPMSWFHIGLILLSLFALQVFVVSPGKMLC